MKCKYCDCELVEGKKFCPECGREQEETPAEWIAAEEAAAEEVGAAESATAETAEHEIEEHETEEHETEEPVKAAPGKIALAVAAGVVVLALLVALVISGIDGDLFKDKGETLPSEETVAATEATVPPTTPPDGNPEDVTCKGTYTVSKEEIYASADTVVATVGGKNLTIGVLQAYYWDGVYSFLQENGSYAAMLGLDFGQSLDTQLCAVGDISMTWQQYFLQAALDSWHSHQAMALAGEENGFVLEGELLEEKNTIPEELSKMAESYGYEDMDTMMSDYMGPGCSYEDYLHYMDLFYQGYGYLEHVYQNTSFEADEVEAFFLEHEADYAESGITKDGGKYVDVRHILLTPEGGATGADGAVTYSEEEWEACRTAAQEILDQWLAGEATEDSFAELANTHSTDPGSNTAGGLYSYVYEGQMMPEFNDWCFDESRAFGDSGLVKTEYGYHIMFFVKSQDIWYVTAEQDMMNDAVSAKLPEAMEKYPMTVDYSAIKLGLVEFTAG